MIIFISIIIIVTVQNSRYWMEIDNIMNCSQISEEGEEPENEINVISFNHKKKIMIITILIIFFLLTLPFALSIIYEIFWNKDVYKNSGIFKNISDYITGQPLNLDYTHLSTFSKLFMSLILLSISPITVLISRLLISLERLILINP